MIATLGSNNIPFSEPVVRKRKSQGLARSSALRGPVHAGAGRVYRSGSKIGTSSTLTIATMMANGVPTLTKSPKL